MIHFDEISVDMSSEKYQPSLVRELETALILRELSQPSKPHPISQTCQKQSLFPLPNRKKVVSPTPSCDGVTMMSRKRTRTLKGHTPTIVRSQEVLNASQIPPHGLLFQQEKNTKNWKYHKSV